MHHSITAIFEDGVLKPDAPLPLPDGARVTVVVDYPDVTSATNAWDAFDQLCESEPVDSRGDILSRDELHERR